MPIRRVGEAFVLNTTTEGDQYFPEIVELAGGGYVAFWYSGEPLESDEYWDNGEVIRARVFRADGTPLGPLGWDFAVNQNQNSPILGSVLALEDGGFIMQWQTGDLEMGLTGVLARTFNADGTARADEYEVGSHGMHSSLTRLSDGRFLSVWTTWDEIRGRILDKRGNPVGAEFAINATDTGNENSPHAIALAGGRFLVAWETDRFLWEETPLDPDGISIRARVFGADGKPIGGDFQLNTSATLADFSTLRSLEVRPDGRVLATWQSFEADGAPSLVMGRLLGPDGRPDGGEFPISDGNGAEGIELTALADGRTLASWSGDGALTAELRDAAGEAIGDAFVIDAPGDASVHARKDGRILLAWSDPYGSGGDSYAQLFDPTAFAGTAAADFWTGGSLDDRIAGNGGDDILRGRAGNDRLTGGDGDDTLDGGSGDDLIVGGGGNDLLAGWTGEDRMEGGSGDDTYTVDTTRDLVIELTGKGTDTVLASVDATLAANLEALTLTGRGAIDGTGNALANTLIGNAGDNVLRGGSGADRLEGGDGRDSLNGGPDADRLLGGTGRDVLTGGSDADTFVFRSAAEAGRGAQCDVITDFTRGADLIGLAGIDTGPGSPGDQGFAFVGGAAFSGDRAEVRFQGGTLAGDIDGDGSGDFQVALSDIARLGGADILL